MTRVIIDPYKAERISNFSVTGDTIALACSNVSASAQFPTLEGNNLAATDVMIINNGTKTAWITFGDSAPTAAIPTGDGANAKNGIPILAGAVMVLYKGQATYVAGITSGADTTTLYLSQGYGA